VIIDVVLCHLDLDNRRQRRIETTGDRSGDLIIGYQGWVLNVGPILSATGQDRNVNLTGAGDDGM